MCRSRPCAPISIHALCEEGDGDDMRVLSLFDDFYPRPLRGGRPSTSATSASSKRFLSTPSARRATPQLRRPSAHRAISIHALCEEGDVSGRLISRAIHHFYPRPLRGGRPAVSRSASASFSFLSTPSARRATSLTSVLWGCSKISIHALCEEGDPWSCGRCRWRGYFYPRPLRGGRPFLVDLEALLLQISIHALCEEGDG